MTDITGRIEEWRLFTGLGAQTLDDEHVLGFLRLLLPAGAETTYRSSSNLLFGLLTNSDQLRALDEDRSLMLAAIEEGLRWEAPLTSISRLCVKDTEVEVKRALEGLESETETDAPDAPDTDTDDEDETDSDALF